MISVLIDTHDDETALAATLACLVPAAAEGIVREVVVADRGSRDGTREIADALGCRLVDGGRAEALAELKAEWVLVLRPGVRLDSDWPRDTIAFMEWASRRGVSTAAVFRLSVDRYGLRARLSEWAASRPGVWRAGVAVVARREALRDGARLRLHRLRARAFLPD